MVRLPTLTAEPAALKGCAGGKATSRTADAELEAKDGLIAPVEAKDGGNADPRVTAALRLRRASVALSNDDLSAIRSVTHPPLPVRRLCEALYLVTLPLIGVKVPPSTLEWRKVKLLLVSQTLQDTVAKYDVDKLQLAPEIIAFVRAEYFANGRQCDRLTHARMKKASRSAGLLFEWVDAVLDVAMQGVSRNTTPSIEAVSTPGTSRAPTPTAAQGVSWLPTAEPAICRKASKDSAAPVAPTVLQNLLTQASKGLAPPSVPLSSSQSQLQLPDLSPRSPVGSPGGELKRSQTFRRFRRQSLPTSLPTWMETGTCDKDPVAKPMRSCSSQPTLGSPKVNARDKKVIVLAGTTRKTIRIIAQRLLNAFPNLVLVLALHGEDACKAVESTFAEEAAFLLERIEFEPIDTDNVIVARACAARIASKHPIIDNVVIDSKAFRELPGAMTMVLRRCDAVFNVFRRQLAHEARVIVISAAYAEKTFRQIPEAQRSKLFPEVAPCRLEELVSVGRAFASELGAAKGFNWQLPCKSLGGWWLDPDGFPFLLVNALVRSWQQRQAVGLCICACGCVPGARPEADEAQTVLMLMDSARNRDSVAGHLFTNFAAPIQWDGSSCAV